MRQLFLLFFITFIPYWTYSQDKYEKEVRIKEDSVPQNAIDFVSELRFSNKVKWYKETGLTSSSVEAKTKHLGIRYSIEFSMDGKLEDAELKVEFDDVPQKVKEQISKYLTQKYSKYSIIKIQVQYTGKEDDVLSFLINKDENLSIETNYEIIVGAKVNNAFKSYEYLFSEKGDFIKSSKIVKKNTVNIEF